MHRLMVVVALGLCAACSDDGATATGGGGASAGGASAGGAPGTAGGSTGGGDVVCGASEPLDQTTPTGAWSQGAPLPGGPRQETAVVALDGLVYALGGFTLASITDLVEAYDPVSDSWVTRAPLPTPLHHANAAAAGGKLVVLGYLTGGTFDANGAGYAYDPASDSWSSLPAMPSGSERGAGAVGVIGDSVLIAGGFRNGAAVADVSLFDTVSEQWSSLPSLPTPRDHGAGAVVDDVFYLVGGRQGLIESATSEVLSISLGAPEWCAMSPLPTARGGIAAGVVDGRIVVVGGEGNLADPSGVFREVEMFDPVTNRWRVESPLEEGRHGTAAAVVGGTLVVPGGADQQAFGAIDSVVGFELGR